MTTTVIATNDMIPAPAPAGEENSSALGSTFSRVAGGAWSMLKSVAKKAFNFACAHPVVTTIGLLVAGNWLSGGALVAGAAMLPVMLDKWLLAKSASAAFSMVSPIMMPIISGVQTLITHSDVLGTAAKTALDVAMPGVGAVMEGGKFVAQHPEIATAVAKTALNVAMPGATTLIEGGKLIAQHPEIATTVAKTAIDVVAPGVVPALHVAKTVAENPGLIGQALDIAARIAMPELNFFR